MSGPIVALGESLGLVHARRTGGFDMIADAEVSFGGAESNVAIGVARLGGSSAWVGRLGDDAIGRRVIRGLRAEGVQVHAAIDAEAPTALMLKDRPRVGRSRVTYYRVQSSGSRIAADDLPIDLIRSAAILHVTGISLAIGEQSARTIMHAVDVARRAGVLVSFDVNHRSRLWSGARAAAGYRELASQSDIVFAGEDEARLMVAGDTAFEQADALRSLGAAEAVIKRGEHGSVAVTADERQEQAAFPVEVVDTVGAGDAFVAGYLAELVRGSALSERLTMASSCGAAACRGEGDWESLPSRADVDDLLAGDSEPVQR